jgi:hypothetical protein
MKTTRRNFIKGVLAWLEVKQKAAEEDEPACPLYLCDIYGQFRDSENSVYGIPITAAIEDLPSCELGYIECPTVSMNVSPASTYLARKDNQAYVSDDGGFTWEIRDLGEWLNEHL